MNIHKRFFQISIALPLILAVPLFASGYGYMGNLPKLGGKTKAVNQIEIEEKTETPEVKASSIIVPRIAPAYKINKYSNYLADIKKIDTLLREIRDILENEDQNKIQFFCAKVNLLNLYINTFKEKYGETPEQHYESYKQLVVLDKYLIEIVDYKRGIEKSLELKYKTLENRTIENRFLNQKIKKVIIPINTVIEIIDETG